MASAHVNANVNVVSLMVKYTRRRSFKRRPVRRYRRKLRSRKGAGVPRIRNPYGRRFKRIRKYNKAKLSLQSRLQSGQSLPYQTAARFYWKGSGTINFTSTVDNGNNPGSVALGNMDQVFWLNDVNYQMDPLNMGVRYNNFKGDFSYKPVWSAFYAESLVMGSKIKLRISRPVYPSFTAKMYFPNDGNTVPPVGIRDDMRVPSNAMHGFWYIRVRYQRATDETLPRPSDFVGHATNVSDNTLWSNMRDFQSDASVSWKRDRLPRATKMGFLKGASNITTNGNLFSGNTDATATFQPYYEVSLSNAPVTWTFSYSLRKHLMDKNAIRNATWSGLRTDGGTPAPVPEKQLFLLKMGYIAFDATGTTCFCTPIDRIADRTVEAEIQYYVLLREPRITPFKLTPPVAAERLVIPDTVPGLSTERSPDPQLLETVDPVSVESEWSEHGDPAETIKSEDMFSVDSLTPDDTSDFEEGF